MLLPLDIDTASPRAGVQHVLRERGSLCVDMRSDLASRRRRTKWGGSESVILSHRLRGFASGREGPGMPAEAPAAEL